MVTAGLAPQHGRMSGMRLADRCDDTLFSQQKLLDKLKPNPSAGADDQPRGHLPVSIQGVRNVVHGGHNVRLYECARVVLAILGA